MVKPPKIAALFPGIGAVLGSSVLVIPLALAMNYPMAFSLSVLVLLVILVALLASRMLLFKAAIAPLNISIPVAPAHAGGRLLTALYAVGMFGGSLSFTIVSVGTMRGVMPDTYAWALLFGSGLLYFIDERIWRWVGSLARVLIVPAAFTASSGIFFKKSLAADGFFGGIAVIACCLFIVGWESVCAGCVSALSVLRSLCLSIGVLFCVCYVSYGSLVDDIVRRVWIFDVALWQNLVDIGSAVLLLFFALGNIRSIRRFTGRVLLPDTAVSTFLIWFSYLIAAYVSISLGVTFFHLMLLPALAVCIIFGRIATGNSEIFRSFRRDVSHRPYTSAGA